MSGAYNSDGSSEPSKHQQVCSCHCAVSNLQAPAGLTPNNSMHQCSRRVLEVLGIDGSWESSVRSLGTGTLTTVQDCPQYSKLWEAHVHRAWVMGLRLEETSQERICTLAIERCVLDLISMRLRGGGSSRASACDAGVLRAWYRTDQ